MGDRLMLAIPDWETEMEEWMICLRSRSALHVIRSFFAAGDMNLPRSG